MTNMTDRPEVKRKLVSVRTVSQLRPIPDADMIEVAVNYPVLKNRACEREGANLKFARLNS
jgi:hypothetical protein